MFLSFGDVAEDESDSTLSVHFYAFGIEDVPAKIMDAHLLPRKLTEATCKGKTRMDNPTGLCAEQCHLNCDPTAGKKKFHMISKKNKFFTNKTERNMHVTLFPTLTVQESEVS